MKKIYYLLLFITVAAGAQTISIPDANFKARLLQSSTFSNIAIDQSGNQIKIDANNDNEIQILEALNVYKLNIYDSSIADLSGIDNFVNLKGLYASDGQLVNLDLSALINLEELNVSSNPLLSINLTGLTLLQTLSIDNTQITTLNTADLTSLETLDCYNTKITMLTLSGLNNLIYVNAAGNSLLTSLIISDAAVLGELYCSSNPLMANLSLSNAPALYSLSCYGGKLTNLNLSLANLGSLDCGNNLLSVLDLSGVPQLTTLNCYNNQLTTIDVSALSQLGLFNCSNNLFTSLDVTDNPNMCLMDCSNNPNLVSVFMKNGAAVCGEQHILNNNPNLQYVCTDEQEALQLINYFGSNGMNVNVNSYCSFTPGGIYNTISGNIKFDADNNGCDANDFIFDNIKINLSTNTDSFSTFTDSEGNYKFYTLAGAFTLSPSIENASFFNISPVNAPIVFPLADGSVSSQDFCITANGTHSDLEVVVAPVAPARPGFDAIYKIVYKNKGNQVMSQQYGVSFSYNTNILSLVAVDIPTSTQGAGTLTWDYANLQPFESRSILVTLHVNGPMDENPVNINDILDLTAIISPQGQDETGIDNIFIFHQTVIGSYDPNDITCIEGDVLPPSEIGKYLHYIVNFENTGTAEAQNIVVKDSIDSTKFDVSSLQILNSSHSVRCVVKGGIVEFIFEGINLDTGGHGNILLKMKSKTDLVIGDIVTKNADIFFDYNFPIKTNDANTVFQALGIDEHATDTSISIYPNPAHNQINIAATTQIQSVMVYDIRGRLMQTKRTAGKATTIDISKQAAGIYLLKVISDKGTKIQKIIKQ